ncbi:MAG: hypothetical protein IT303_13930 [Dehalococcoidia bacterium]|nr:hypothetical protein [Dehalococcoidia bacterium]
MMQRIARHKRRSVLLLLVLALAADIPLVSLATRNGPSHVDDQVRALEAELARDDLSPELRTSLEEKLAIARDSRSQELQAAGRDPDPAADAAKKARLAGEAARIAETPRPPLTCTPLGDGCLLLDFTPPVSSQVFLPTSAWSIEDNGGRLVVMAGSIGGDLQQGGVLVVRYVENQPPDIGAVIPAAGRTGPLEVAAEFAKVIQLRAPNGTTLAFDATQLTFLSK